jgi:hypothetical protein
MQAVCGGQQFQKCIKEYIFPKAEKMIPHSNASQCHSSSFFLPERVFSPPHLELLAADVDLFSREA